MAHNLCLTYVCKLCIDLFWFSQLMPKGSKSTIFDLGPKERFKMIRDVNRSRQSSRRGSFVFSKNGSQRNKNGIRDKDPRAIVLKIWCVRFHKYPRKRQEYVIPFVEREDRGLEVYVLFALISFLAWFSMFWSFGQCQADRVRRSGPRSKIPSHRRVGSLPTVGQKWKTSFKACFCVPKLIYAILLPMILSKEELGSLSKTDELYKAYL